MTSIHMPTPFPGAAPQVRWRPSLLQHPEVQALVHSFGLGSLLLAAVAVFGLGVITYRFYFGLGASTNLSDQFPWGLWIGIDVLTGVAIAGGAFTLAGIVHILHVRRFEPLLRPAILTAFLGYALVIVALLTDIGRPYNIWHPIVMWQPRSMLFEVAWCVMLYTTVLALEFSPALFERLRWRRLLGLFRLVLIPLVMTGIILSTLHQSSLGGLYLIAKTKLDPLWYTAWLPVFFWLSAVGGGLSMVIVEASLSARAFKHKPDLDLLGGVAKISAAVLAIYFGFKTWDLWNRGALELLYSWRFQNLYFIIEMLLGVALPALLLASPWVRRSPVALLTAASLAVCGLVLNRVNIALTGMWEAAGRAYVPSWQEFAVTAGIVALGVLAFKVIATLLPVFEEPEEDRIATRRPRPHRPRRRLRADLRSNRVRLRAHGFPVRAPSTR